MIAMTFNLRSRKPKLYGDIKSRYPKITAAMEKLLYFWVDKSHKRATNSTGISANWTNCPLYILKVLLNLLHNFPLLNINCTEPYLGPLYISYIIVQILNCKIPERVLPNGAICKRFSKVSRLWRCAACHLLQVFTLLLLLLLLSFLLPLLLLSMMTLITGCNCPPTIYFKFITKCDKHYYKVRQLFLLQSAMVCYYKVRQVLLQSATGISKCDNFITKCDRYYKVRRLLQSTTVHTCVKFRSQIK